MAFQAHREVEACAENYGLSAQSVKGRAHEKTRRCANTGGLVPRESSKEMCSFLHKGARDARPLQQTLLAPTPTATTTAMLFTRHVVLLLLLPFRFYVDEAGSHRG